VRTGAVYCCPSLDFFQHFGGACSARHTTNGFFFSPLGRVFFSLTHMYSCFALEGMTPSVGDQSTMDRVTVATAIVGAAVRASAKYVALNAIVSPVRWPQIKCEHNALAAPRMKNDDTSPPRHLSRQLDETFGRPSCALGFLFRPCRFLWLVHVPATIVWPTF